MTHSETDDASGHVWGCQDISYDEGISASIPTPAQGLPTTVKVYSDCANQSTTAITSYTGYDGPGNVVATVDGMATAHPSLYGSSGKTSYNGCALTTAPVILTPSWTAGRFTACTVYDSNATLPTSFINALSQQSFITYDPHQGDLPIQTKDLNGRITTSAYSYDGSGTLTMSNNEPGETNTYTNQSTNATSCPSTIPSSTSVITPCFETDSTTQQYNTVQSRTFYDGLGRPIETRTPGPGANDTIVFTVYDATNNTTFQSVPFQVARGSSWVDPNTALGTDGKAPAGTTTFYDALGRAFAMREPIFGSSGVPGITCSTVPNHTTIFYTSCINYGLGTVTSDPNVHDTNTYATVTSIDPNNHVSISFLDALGRVVYVQYDSGGGANNGPLTPNELKIIQYNPIGLPTQMKVDDLVPQSNQTVTSVTTTTQYDDLGRATSTTDPDRGTFTYTYDADGRTLSSTSGTRIIGINYDLMGRVGCVQDAAPTINADGSCTAGTHPFVQNTYDTTANPSWVGSDYPVGRLTQSIATTTYPDTGNPTVTTTTQIQHDQRGRVVTEQLSLGLPTSWNVATLPTYQLSVFYNDANQPQTVTTSTLNPTASGYTTTQVYDSTGALAGLSNNSGTTANLATLHYNVNAQVDTLNYLSSTSSNLAQEQFTYDGDLRPFSATATWQSGSGSSGQIFAQSMSYDAAGNVSSLATTQAVVPGQTGSGGSETQNFCYDEQNRLVWAGNSGTQPGAGNGTCGTGTLGTTLSGASYTNTFVYTHLGQLWQGPLNGSSTSYQYFYCDSGPHQLSGIFSSGTTCATKSGQLYKSTHSPWGDVSGRTYQGVLATLTNDSLDHLVKWGIGGGNNEYYAYDAAGNRVLRRSSSSGITTLTVYAFGLEEYSYDGTGTLQPQKTIHYYRLGGTLLGELSGSPAATNFFMTDGLGSVMATFSNIAGSASVQGNQVYGPYGSQRYTKGSMGTNKGFTGQYNDSVTGLDYYNARYYDPVVGVFLSADVVQGNGQGMNPYAYVGGNPETMNDPSGQSVSCSALCQITVGATKGTDGGGTSPGVPPGLGCGSCTANTNAANVPLACGAVDCKMFARIQLDVHQQVPVGASVGSLICSLGPVCITVTFQINTAVIYKGTIEDTMVLCTNHLVCLDEIDSDETDESAGDQQTNNSDRGLLNRAEEIAAMGDEAGGAGKGIDSGAGAGEQAGNGQPTESPGSSGKDNMGRGTIFSHFTDATGANGITGVDPESLNVGQTVSVSELNFGQGTNTFMAGESGDIFVTELGADATPGQLERIGVFGDKQSFVIQFSQEAALLNDARVSPVWPERSIFSIPGGSTLKDFEFLLTRLQ